MPFNIADLIAKEYPELVSVYNEFKGLEKINEEKLKTINHYLKHLDDGSIKELDRLFKKIKKLMLKDEKEENIEKVYTLRLLHELIKKKDKKISSEIGELINSLDKLSKILSKQFALVYSDQLKWGLKSNFHDFTQLVLVEQKIIKGDLKFLDDVTQHYRQQINEELKLNAQNVKIIGHRGARGLYPENTIGSMGKGAQYRANMVEFDVQLCRTGEVIVMHDYKVDRTTNGHGFVKELSWEDLSELKMRGTNENVPRLEDVIKFLPARCGMNIELKAHNASTKEIYDLAKEVIKLIAKYNVPANRFIISSFNHKMLSIMKNMASSFRIATLFDDFGASTWLGFKHLIRKGAYHANKISRKIINMGLVKRTKYLGAEAINPPMDLVDKDLIELAHDTHLQVNVWTVNNPYMMVQLILWGVDGIITDRPDILLSIKNSLVNF